MVNEARAFMNDTVDRLDNIAEQLSKRDSKVVKEEYAVRTVSAVADANGTMSVKIADIPLGGVWVLDRVTVSSPDVALTESPLLTVGTDPLDVLEVAAWQSSLDPSAGSKAFTFKCGYTLRGPLPLMVVTPALSTGNRIMARAIIRVLGDPTNS